MNITNIYRRGCILKLPKMILFDYGQTLVDESEFDGVKGTEAVLKYAVKNKYNRTAQEIQDIANETNKELGRIVASGGNALPVEVPNHMFTSYLYESQGIELSLTSKEIDQVFWDVAAPGVPTEGIEDFLTLLKKKGIRTGVISNIAYCGEVVAQRINCLIPDNDFEFIIASSEYMYRKPNKKIFELALEKAELSADEVWFIGDNYQLDVIGSQKAGMFPVWYIGAAREPCRKENEVLTVESYYELAEMIGKI